jgi:hypothetical protein
MLMAGRYGVTLAPVRELLRANPLHHGCARWADSLGWAESRLRNPCNFNNVHLVHLSRYQNPISRTSCTHWAGVVCGPVGRGGSGPLSGHSPGRCVGSRALANKSRPDRAPLLSTPPNLYMMYTTEGGGLSFLSTMTKSVTGEPTR